jgi:predicted transcriptional regulator
MAVKTSVNLSDDAVNALREVAKERNTTMTEVLRHAVSLEKFVHDETKQGSKILVEKSDGNFRELLPRA